METSILLNRNLPDEQLKKILAFGSEDEPILFGIVGEVSKEAKYAQTVLLATSSHFFTYSFADEECSTRYAFSDIKEIHNKRMYGNAVMRVSLDGDKYFDAFRFTFTVTALCDSFVTYVKDIRNGGDAEAALEMMRSVYDKMLSVCPKCGRTLSAPGAPCVHCMKKGRLFRRLVQYLKPEAPILIISVIISVLTTAMALVPPLLTQSLVDDILPNSDRAALTFVVVLLICIHVVRWFMAGVRGYMLRVSGNKIIARIRTDVYEKAQYLPMRFYDKTSTGSVINRISGDTATIQAFMLRMTQEVVVQFFKLIGIVVVMLCMNWKLTLFSLVPVPLVVIGSRIFRKKIAPFYRRIWRRSSAVTSVLTDTIPGIRVVKSFANEKKSADRFEQTVEEWREIDSKAGKILHSYPAIVNCLMSLGSVIIWAMGGNLVINGIETNSVGTISVGLLVSFISYATMFYEPVNFFANLSDSMQSAMASVERIMDIL
ncbi:MAG: hypothetical protein IIX25_00330, partial [Clostridia bacterium]|nr:hypothetical protein [Clostridia bacterium]